MRKSESVGERKKCRELERDEELPSIQHRVLFEGIIIE